MGDFWGSLPQFSFAIAYGSKAVQQRRMEPRSTLLDLLIAISDNAAEWHSLNMSQNAGHYSRLSRLSGPATVARMQRIAPKLHFNTMVQVQRDGTRMKYGVSGESDIVEDLQDWRSLYVAGRMHKPFFLLDPESRTVLPDVGFEVPSRMKEFADSVRRNREHALVWALLQSAPQESWGTLLRRICSLSYAGDVRSYIGEAPTKVPDIVAGQAAVMSALYLPLAMKYAETHGVSLKGDFDSALLESRERAAADVRRGAANVAEMLSSSANATATPSGLNIDRAARFDSLRVSPPADEEAREELFETLPTEFVNRCNGLSAARRLRALYSPRQFLRSDFERHGRPRPHDVECLVDAAKRLVLMSSTVGSLKAAVSAGLRKSMRYGMRKAMLA
eukprot:Polyplicarium_translucidae@DN2908_c0_g1_i1.p1